MFHAKSTKLLVIIVVCFFLLGSFLAPRNTRDALRTCENTKLVDHSRGYRGTIYFDSFVFVKCKLNVPVSEEVYESFRTINTFFWLGFGITGVLFLIDVYLKKLNKKHTSKHS
jgi:hypothetical protein